MEQVMTSMLETGDNEEMIQEKPMSLAEALDLMGCHYVGVDISKLTLDIALYDGELDWKSGHVRMGNIEEGYVTIREWQDPHGVGKPKARLRTFSHLGLLMAHDVAVCLG